MYFSRFLLLPLYLLHRSAVIRGAAVLNNVTDAFIEKVLFEWGSPGGIAIAVVQRDDQGNWTIETKGYGIATANGSQVTDKTLFAMGSTSKLFTTIATGLLINNETITPRLSWESKLASIIPDWSLEDTVATEQASIIDLMSHRTGLPRHDFSYKWSDDVPSIIKKLKSQRPSVEFRQLWQYNNNMYTTLSYLPTVLLPSKIPFARYVKQHILDPIGLSSTTYSYDVAKTGHLADGFTRQNINFSVDPFVGINKTFPYWSTVGGEDGNILSGAGGVISNAFDMATWLQLLLLDGVKPDTNTQIVDADIIQKVATGVTVVNGAASFPELSPSIYGGGQIVSTYRGHEVVEHDGGVPGFTSLVTRLPFDNLGIAVLSNDGDYGSFIMNIVRYYLIDDALGLNKIDWNTRYKQLVTSSVLPPPGLSRRPNATLPSVPFTSLAGVYDNAGYGESELCYVSPAYPTESKSCRELNANLSTILPGAVEPDVPTFIAKWDGPWTSHMKLSHFDENYFNISILRSVPNADQESEPFWTYSVQDPGANAEFVINGNISLALTGIWGAGPGVPNPQGPTVRDRAEVWFDKVAGQRHNLF